MTPPRPGRADRGARRASPTCATQVAGHHRAAARALERVVAVMMALREVWMSQRHGAARATRPARRQFVARLDRDAARPAHRALRAAPRRAHRRAPQAAALLLRTPGPRRRHPGADAGTSCSPPTRSPTCCSTAIRTPTRRPGGLTADAHPARSTSRRTGALLARRRAAAARRHHGGAVPAEPERRHHRQRRRQGRHRLHHRAPAASCSRSRSCRSICAIVAVYFGARTAMALRPRRARRAVPPGRARSPPARSTSFGAPSLITRNTNDVQQVQMLVLLTCTMMVAAPIMWSAASSWRCARTSGCPGCSWSCVPLLVARHRR